MSMSLCDVCHSPLTTVIPDQLMKCPFCGLYKYLRPPEQAQVQAGEYEQTEEETEPNKPARAFSPIGDDMETFITRVSERLMPVHADYSPDVKKKLLTNRARYHKELLDVFTGKGNLENWFNKTRTELGLHAITLTKICYESLEGLRSKDAQEIRMQYAEYLQKLGNMYQMR